MFTRSVEIPEIKDIQNITFLEFEEFKRIGACYIKAPTAAADSLDNIKNVAMRFFVSSPTHKKSFLHDRRPTNELGKSFSTGYLDRSTDRSKFESYRQKIGDEVLPLFVNNAADLEVLKRTVIDLIILKLVSALVNFLNFHDEPKQQLDSMTLGAKAWLQLNYCPKPNFYDNIINKASVAPHKDISLVSIISNDSPGLCIWHNGVWHDVLPRKGYLIAIFGKLANSITQGQVNAPLHVVKDVKERRISTVLFFAGKAGSSVYSMEGKLLGSPLTSYEAALEMTLFNRRKNMDSFVNNLYFGVNGVFLMGMILKSILSRQENFSFSYFYKEIFRFSSNFILLNSLLFLMNRVYFVRMYLDYLQYADKPNYATESELKAYKIGTASVTFFGIINSFFDDSAYKHRSFWNAGLLSSLLENKK